MMGSYRWYSMVSALEQTATQRSLLLYVHLDLCNDNNGGSERAFLALVESLDYQKF
jgi:hypothetical protein